MEAQENWGLPYFFIRLNRVVYGGIGELPRAKSRSNLAKINSIFLLLL